MAKRYPLVTCQSLKGDAAVADLRWTWGRLARFYDFERLNDRGFTSCEHPAPHITSVVVNEYMQPKYPLFYTRRCAFCLEWWDSNKQAWNNSPGYRGSMYAKIGWEIVGRQPERKFAMAGMKV